MDKDIKKMENQMKKFESHQLDLFTDFHSHHQRMMRRFDEMTKKMMDNFDEYYEIPSPNFDHSNIDKLMKMQDLKDFTKEFDFKKEIEELPKISQLPRSLQGQAQNQKGPYTVFHRSTCQSSMTGHDGNQITQSYNQSNVSYKTEDGQVIAERSQEFIDPQTKKRYRTIEKHLNDKAYKTVQELDDHGNVVSSQNYFQAITDQDQNLFDQTWEEVNQKSGFKKNHSPFFAIGSGKKK